MNTEWSLNIAGRAVERCFTLAKLSEETDRTTRTFLSPPMHEVHHLVRSWMESAGMTVTIDPIGNIHGLLPASAADAPRLLIGSHLDTVPGAGPFDGVLGVMLGIGLIESMRPQRPDVAIEIVGFSEEEGVRFGVPFLASRALAGFFDRAILQRQDARGVTMGQAIRDFGLNPDRIDEVEYRGTALGYVEFHIEQGPVLDSLDVPVGVVTAIAGQTRLEATFLGKTNHAGTTPMHLRRDALAAASEWVLDVEREASATPGLVATVGSLKVVPGASNVIPGEVRATLDARHADDSVRTAAVGRIKDRAKMIVARRGLELTWQVRLEESAVACDSDMTVMMARSIEMAGYPVHRLVSGAGHDAMIMASRMPVAMLFIRSPDGVSHHSSETVKVEDVAAALQVASHFVKQVALPHA